MKNILATASLFVLSAAAGAQTFVGTGLSASTFYGGVLLDIQDVSLSAIELTGRIHFVTNWTGDGIYRACYRSGSYAGHELDQPAWTQWAEVSVANASGPAAWTTLDLGSGHTLNPGDVMGFVLFHVDGSGIGVGDGAVGYRSGGGTFGESALQITTGAYDGHGTYANPFDTHTGSPRTGVVEFEYAPVPEPASLSCLTLGALALYLRRRIG